MDFWERHLIKSHDTMSPKGYNCTEGVAGLKHTPEHCAKIAAALTGKKRPFLRRNVVKVRTKTYFARWTSGISLIRLWQNFWAWQKEPFLTKFAANVISRRRKLPNWLRFSDCPPNIWLLATMDFLRRPRRRRSVQDFLQPFAMIVHTKICLAKWTSAR